MKFSLKPEHNNATIEYIQKWRITPLSPFGAKNILFVLLKITKQIIMCTKYKR
ncbi:hypothetical protein Q457_24885 [Escherichia coli ATCC BAA-2196]|nr:hypothetical protein FORC64_4444 [Escherichia coli]ETD44472.1 hypothetical protein Q459_23995 [Escherichia coli ATCC BAA-2215]ETI72338.1 hypothetical protein Q457_24885 [Escherichia coli ATCC BAA-2196]ETI78417.1 hypothetical protein Q460_08820 [Escherichia coli ATCC BAA-2219]ETJ58304.1 hypothetical protein Q456_0214455 [Escherichia coli ATCC BAA-2193]